MECCNKKDCSLYGFYYAPKEHPYLKKLDLRIKIDTKQGNKSSATAELVEYVNAINYIRTNCFSCIYFTKNTSERIYS